MASSGSSIKEKGITLWNGENKCVLYSTLSQVVDVDLYDKLKSFLLTKMEYVLIKLK